MLNDTELLIDEEQDSEIPSTVDPSTEQETKGTEDVFTQKHGFYLPCKSM